MSRVVFASMTAVCALCSSAPAHGQSTGSPSLLSQPPLVQPSTVTAAAEQTAAPAPGKFEEFDQLNYKGWDIPFPKTADTILADLGGHRQWLADHGIGYMGIALNTLQYDFRQDDHGYRGTRLYNGQDKVARTGTTFALYGTYDLGQIGISGGQIGTTFIVTSNSFKRVDGPHSVRLGRLNYYQSLFGRKLELKIGIFDNGSEFLGTNVGGSLATGNLGPTGVVPYEVGMSFGGYGTLAANLRVNFRNHVYDKFGIQRSLPPGGAAAEVAGNPSGLTARVRGSGVLFINEFGYNRPSSAGVRSTWLRVGGMVNTTDFTRFGSSDTQNNWMAFAAIDRQLTQPDRERPFRGVYVGATIDKAPAKVDFVATYYEARIYGIGLLKGRPSDLVSLVANYSGYSRSGLLSRVPEGQGLALQTVSLVGSYAYRLMPGLYMQPGLGVAIHPVYSPRFGPALNGYLSLTALF